MILLAINSCQRSGYIQVYIGDLILVCSVSNRKPQSLLCYLCHNSTWNNDQPINFEVKVAPEPPGTLSLFATWPPGLQDPAGHTVGEGAPARPSFRRPCGHPGLLTLVGRNSASGTGGRQSMRLRDSCVVPSPVLEGLMDRAPTIPCMMDRWLNQVVWISSNSDESRDRCQTSLMIAARRLDLPCRFSLHCLSKKES